MTSKENSDARSCRKSRSPHLVCKTLRSNSLGSNRTAFNNVKNSMIPLKKNKGLIRGETDSTCSNETSSKEGGEKIKCNHSSSDLTLGSQSNSSKKRGISEDREKHGSSRVQSSSPHTRPERKSLKSMVSVSSSVCEKGKKNETLRKGKKMYKMEFLEGTEPVSLLMLAAAKQSEVIQSLQWEKAEFRRKMTEEDGKIHSKEIYELGFFFSPEERNHSPESVSTCYFDESYSNCLDEILHVWINLFYFIINLRVKLIKILNKSGRENFVPNANLEREIISKAIESVKLFSTLKIKSLAEALDRYRFREGNKDAEMEVIKSEHAISSSFIYDMEYLGNKAKEIVSRLKKANEKIPLQ